MAGPGLARTMHLYIALLSRMEDEYRTNTALLMFCNLFVIIFMLQDNRKNFYYIYRMINEASIYTSHLMEKYRYKLEGML